MASSGDTTLNDVAENVVTIEQEDGMWWFVGPDGERFVTRGVNHIEPHLWLGPYNREETIERYGEGFVTMYDTFNPYGEAAERWMKRVVGTATDLGFDSFGKHVQDGIPHQYYADDIYYIASLDTAAIPSWEQVQDNAFKKFGPFPDPFSEAFERDLAHQTEQLCYEHRGNETLLGYFYADLPWWQLRPDEQRAYDEHTFIYPWATAIIQMSPGTAGKEAWIDVLREQYEMPTEAATVYGLDAEQWADLKDVTAWFDPNDEESVRGDLLALMKRVAERWYGLHHEYIRRYDEKHLLLGDKQNFVPEWLMEFLEAYVDVNVIQRYEPFEAHRKMTRTLYEETGNPVFNGDGSFSVVRPEQSDQECKGYHLDNEEAVGEAYAAYLETSLSEPYMLGWHHCGMLEQWDSSGRGDIATSETGFLDPFENEYEVITERIRDANAKAIGWHENAAATGGVADE